MDQFIFVYGTLRKAFESPMSRLLAEHCDYCSEAVMQGRLYEVNGYPGALESADPQDQVHGELYRITNRVLPDSETLLKQLDDYEQCTERYPAPHEYRREQVVISTRSGARVTAWVYIYNHDVTLLQLIQSGDYLSFVKERNGSSQGV